MQEFVPGQRWINHAELALGLGTVLTVEHRTVQIVFLASGETRVYAKETAPLTRVRFTTGDEVRDAQGNSLQVQSIEDQDGLLVYHCLTPENEKQILPETQLDNHIQLSKPQERLFSGQIDANKWFALRYQSWQHHARLMQSPLRGLSGARTSLIPHQLYIAQEVARRHAPRVLLADEVGLGKTIEAGLIIHHQLLSERAQRVLILVPDTLLHQWLVEMLRRFNLHFSIFDAERIAASGSAIEFEDVTGELAEDDFNPFSDEQLVLCSLDFLCANDAAYQQALGADWDLLVVDEAHHLQWSEAAPSKAYSVVEGLARQTPGVLLLTATPEQLGKASHFARLRLLDPDRFSSYNDFCAEERGYEPIADAVEGLLEPNSAPADLARLLSAVITDADDQPLIQKLETASESDSGPVRSQLVDHLLDRHGTGRVLFRNTRAAVSGFPGRELHSYPLPLPAEYQANELQPEAQHRVAIAGNAWVTCDGRIEWLRDFIKQHRQEKILLITHSAETALDIAEALRVSTGLHAAVFHEGMSIIERDRAAAFFSDHEDGSPILLCSEIGSEGRNFQFAHHLVLFDLPANPDLLEQRIGRLDRIGQTQTIQIHVPYFTGSAQEILLDWYHRGLNALQQVCPAAHSVYVEMQGELQAALAANQCEEEFISRTAELTHALNEQLHQGRDRLLEYNSCRPHKAEQLTREVQKLDQENDIGDYMEAVFDCYGVMSEPHSEQATIIRPGDNMVVPFPQLPDEGMTLTYERSTALANEDLHFLSWEHGMVRAAMEMVLSGEKGNCSTIAVKTAGLKPGTLLLEAIFVLECSQGLNRYLPPAVIRTLLNEKSQALHQAVSFELLNAAAQSLDRNTSNKVVKARRNVLEQLIKQSRQLAEQQAQPILESAHQQAQQGLEEEIHRLQALQRVNPMVRDVEIQALSSELAEIDQAIDFTHVRLDALRIVVAV